MNMKIKAGLIGCDLSLRAGMIFRNRTPGQFEFVAICDRDPEMLHSFHEQLPAEKCRDYSDYRDLLRDPEVNTVFIMVRDQYHEEMAVAALNEGKTVFLEKPMAISIKGCDNILRAAYESGSKLFLGHNMRYAPSIRKMKEIIDSGIIGDIQCVWVRHFINYGSCYFRHFCAERETCNGLLLQKGAHDIDVIHWLAGGYTARVTGMGRLSVYNRTKKRLAPGEKPDRKISFSQECWPPLDVTGLAPHIDVEDHSICSCSSTTASRLPMNSACTLRIPNATTPSSERTDASKTSAISAIARSMSGPRAETAANPISSTISKADAKSTEEPTAAFSTPSGSSRQTMSFRKFLRSPPEMRSPPDALLISRCGTATSRRKSLPSRRNCCAILKTDRNADQTGGSLRRSQFAGERPRSRL